jgi:hypothetical protein
MQPMVIKGGRNRLNGSFALIRKAGSNNHDGTLRHVADLYVRNSRQTPRPVSALHSSAIGRI